jgi:hypothetical protein
MSEDSANLQLNAYQIGNLLGALARATNNGDWWHEVIRLLIEAWEGTHPADVILQNNFGDVFSKADLMQGILKICCSECLGKGRVEKECPHCGDSTYDHECTTPEVPCWWCEGTGVRRVT